MSDRPNHSSEVNGALQVPMPRVVRFIRQLSHDLRNHLNAAELQAAYMSEVVTDVELKGEVQRLRAMVSEMGASLQKLGGVLADVKLNLMPYEATSFGEDLRAKIQSQFPDRANGVHWDLAAVDAKVNIDPQIMQQAFLELFVNAFQHDRGTGPLQARTTRDDSHFVFTLCEPKKQFNASTANWGREPFSKVMHGHYGLGLHRARSIIEAHNGRYDVCYDAGSACLVTTVSLPLLAA